MNHKAKGNTGSDLKRDTAPGANRKQYFRIRKEFLYSFNNYKHFYRLTFVRRYYIMSVLAIRTKEC